ncbi:MAG: hypothetical protein IJ353_06960 [Lachnospiraceae bacterium]|nr:hypothetical protein [Lachnospiraceae bacterium]
MINNEFWKAAASSWSWEARPDVKVKNGSGGQISSVLLKKPWEVVDDDSVEFDKIDYEATMKSMLAGGQVVLKEPVDDVVEAPSSKIAIDTEAFDNCLEQENIEGFTSCFKMLRDCGLPEDVTERLKEIVNRMGVLKDAVSKFKKVYEADISLFMENYIPEALNLSVGYIEYVNANVSEDILLSTQTEVVEALDTLLIGINDKIDEIYKFASIELKATAKALNATMSSDGYVDSKFRIN